MPLAAHVHTVEDQPVLGHNVIFAAHELPQMHGSSATANLNVSTAG